MIDKHHTLFVVYTMLILLILSVSEKLENLIFEIPIVPQTLNINN